MNEYVSSVRHRLFSSTVFLTTCMLLSIGAAQDFNQSLIWSTYSSNGVPQLKLFYGNPATYVPDIANGRNGSYSLNAYFLPGDGLGFGALDMLYTGSYIYYSSNMQLHFSYQDIPETGLQIRIAYVPALSKVVTGISVDWVSRLIYWSDASYQRICVIDCTTYGFWRAVVDTNLTSPQDVVVYPQQSFLFWSDFGDKSVIERYNLATDDRRILFSSPILQRPTKLVVDFASQRLFWLDAAAATIGSMNFDGSSVSSWPPSSTFSSISSFALFQNYIFLGRNDANIIYIYDRSQQYKANITQYGKGIVDMTVYNQLERNPSVSSPCNIRNGECDQLCITVTSTQRRCLCGLGFFLAPNGVNCVTKPMQTGTFLLLTDQSQVNIFQISVDTGEVRALTLNKNVWSLPTALAFDPLRYYLYYYDKRSLVIKRTSMDGTVSTTLPNVTNTLGSDITSLAFDSEDQVLFYVDYIAQTISAMFLLNRSFVDIYSPPGSKPRTIVLDTSNRLLYWSDCGYNTIERGSKTNPDTNRMTIISGLSACAITFAIDFQNQMVFWADASGTIEKARLDGTVRSVVFQDSNAAFTGLALDAQFIYIAASNNRQIQKIDRNTKQLSNLTKILFTQPFALLYGSALSESAGTTGSPPSSTTSIESSTLTPGNNGVTTIIVASVISGSVVLIAVIVTVGVVVVVKRRRAASRRPGNNPVVIIDNSRTYETLTPDQRDDPNPQMFTNESYYNDDISSDARPHSYMSIKFPSECPTRRPTATPPPYGDGNEYISDK